MGRKTWESLPEPCQQAKVGPKPTVEPQEGMAVFRSMDEVKQALTLLKPCLSSGVVKSTRWHSLYVMNCISEVRQKVPDGDAFFSKFKDQFRQKKY